MNIPNRPVGDPFNAQPYEQYPSEGFAPVAGVSRMDQLEHISKSFGGFAYDKKGGYTFWMRDGKPVALIAFGKSIDKIIMASIYAIDFRTLTQCKDIFDGPQMSEQVIRVEVGEMREAGDRRTYWVHLYRPGDKPWDAMSIDKAPTREDAEAEAATWREWLEPALALAEQRGATARQEAILQALTDIRDTAADNSHLTKLLSGIIEHIHRFWH